MIDQNLPIASGVDRIDGVLTVVSELARKSANGDYLYRGEPECYSQVSSGLYRQYSESDTDYFDIEVIQSEILEELKRFIKPQGDDDEVLDQLQHYGHPTNLIDFTTDWNIALFFASDGQVEEDGRVILLDRKATLPGNPEARRTASSPKRACS